MAGSYAMEPLTAALLLSLSVTMIDDELTGSLKVAVTSVEVDNARGARGRLLVGHCWFRGVAGARVVYDIDPVVRRGVTLTVGKPVLPYL